MTPQAKTVIAMKPANAADAREAPRQGLLVVAVGDVRRVDARPAVPNDRVRKGQHNSKRAGQTNDRRRLVIRQVNAERNDESEDCLN